MTNLDIKTSEASHQLIRLYTTRLNIPAENVIARVALAYSLSQGRKLKIGEVADSKGKEYSEKTLFGNRKNIFVGLLSQHYQLTRHDERIPKLVKMHVDDGLELMARFFDSNPNHSIYDFMLENIERGIESIEHADGTFSAVENRNRQLGDKDGFAGALRLAVGADDEGTPILLSLNNTKIYNNSHMAIAGTTGSGKTQFALELLTQIVEQSQGRVNFCYLDFKGLNEEDGKKLSKFFAATQTELINAPHKPFPVNPFSFIDNVNEKNKILGINKLTDIIVDYSNAGANQKQFLRDAIKAVFARRKGGKYPTLDELLAELQNTMDKAKNRVVGIVEGLSQFEMFTAETNRDFLNRNYYFSLSADLPKDIRFTSIFLVINYILNAFMSMPDAPVDATGTRAMRYVLLIDEAQVIFRDAKSKQVLQYILEQIRSKGVSVVLLAQNIEEFNQPNFNFSSLCEIGFLLKINDFGNTKTIGRFLGLSEKETVTIARSMERMQPGQGVSNLREWRRGELFEVRQFWKR